MNIQELKNADSDKIVSVMCDAFIDDALYSHFIEDDAERRLFLEKFMKFRLRFGLEKGKVFVSEDLESVAIWIEPNQKMTLKDLILYGGLAAMLRCDSSQRTKITQFNDFADKQKSQCISPPFWHLSPICVSKKLQGKGYGKALIQHGLEYIKSSLQPCYLETQSDKNAMIYEKYGFECAQKTKICGTCLTNYSMIYSVR